MTMGSASSKQRAWLGLLLLSLAAAIWGGMYVVSAAVLVYIPPWVLLELRFMLAFAVLGVIAWRMHAWTIRRRDLPILILIGLIGYTGSIGMQFVGTALSGAAMGSLITAASPALIAVFAWPMLRERLNRRKVVAVLLATAGVLIVIGLPGGRGTAGAAPVVEGNLILAGAAITWALYTVLSRTQTRVYSSLTVTTWATLFGVVGTTPIAAWQWHALSFALPSGLWIWAGVLYLGIVSTAVALYLWNKGFEYVDAATGALCFFVQPLVGSGLGALLLGERLSWSFLAGVVLIGGSVYVAARSEQQGRPPSPGRSPAARAQSLRNDILNRP
jgi:drug/metabolite transporter (DMT)-like permease